MNFSLSFQSTETPQKTTHSAFLAPEDEEFEKPQPKKLPQISSNKVTEALIDDPNIYEFDSIYDDMKEKKEAEQYGFKPKEKKNQKVSKNQEQRESRYIGKLKKEVERRKIQTQIAWEKMESKERRREQRDPHFQKNEEETYLTQSYLKMMAINKEKQAIFDIEDKINQKKTGGNLSNFYSKLLSKNSAMGGGLRNDEYATDKKPKKKLLDRIEDAYEELKHKEETKELSKKQEEQSRREKAKREEDERKATQRERSVQKETENLKKEEALSREEKLKQAKERYKKRKEEQNET